MEKIVRKRLSDDVVHNIRRAILLGDFTVGEHLAEPSLAERYGTSRAPVRDALTILLREGFVIRLANGHVVVKGIVPEDITNLYDVRLLLETHAIRKWSEMENPLSLEQLRQCMDRMNYNILAIWEFSRLDMEFHELIIRLANNNSLLQSWLGIKETVHSILEITNQSHARGEQILKIHSGIVDFMQRGDIGQAISLLEEHLHEGQTHMNNIIQKLREVAV